MGRSERRRKQAESTSSSPAEREAPHLVVPDGHRVITYSASSVPAVRSSAGGVWLAHFGRGSDELDEELDMILGEVDALMRGPRPRILLSNAAGRLSSLSSLFAPSNPEVVPYAGVLVWIIDAAALAGAPSAASLVQRLLRRIYQMGTRGTPPLQAVFVRETASSRARAVAELIRGLGIDVREPDPNEATVLAEVHRPEGVVLSALVGASYRPADSTDSYAREVNEAKDRAETDGDVARFERLEDEERAELEKKLAPVGGEPRVSSVDRAPRLGRLLLAVAEDGDAARPALYEELLAREIPLLSSVDPKTQGARLREWPGGFVAMAVYADRASLVAGARDLGEAVESFAVAEMPPPQLFDRAASQSWALAINVVRKRNELVYVPLAPQVVRALADGEMPPRTPVK